MTRLEFFFAMLALAAAIIVVLKSKWFERIVDSLLRGTKSVTPDALQADSSRVKTTAQKVAKDKAKLNQL